MDLKTYCDQERGRQAALAAAIKVPPVSISNWAGKKRQVPLAHVLPIERATQGHVTRCELRPEDWHVYWPAENSGEPMSVISAPAVCVGAPINSGAGDESAPREERAAA